MQDIDKFEMVVQAFEYEKEHLKPASEAGASGLFAGHSCWNFARI